jgi:hypothetical protein
LIGANGSEEPGAAISRVLILNAEEDSTIPPKILFMATGQTHYCGLDRGPQVGK